MTGSHDQLTQDTLSTALRGHPFVTEIIYVPRLGSTNDLAKARAAEGARGGLLVIANEQTAGKGRMERRWWAPSGSSLLTSLLFRPAPAPHRTGGISNRAASAGELNLVQELIMLCALAAADAIIELTGLAVELKWPNDLVFCGRKLAGLLAESTFAGDRLDAIVVGLGINVNTDFTDAPSFIAPATSLRLEVGHPIDRLPLLVSYLDGLARRYARLETGISPFDEWASRLATLGRYVTAHLGGRSETGVPSTAGESPKQLSGIAQAVDVDGALLLRSADGMVHRLLAADISLQEKAYGEG